MQLVPLNLNSMFATDSSPLRNRKNRYIFACGCELNDWQTPHLVILSETNHRYCQTLFAINPCVDFTYAPTTSSQTEAK